MFAVASNNMVCPSLYELSQEFKLLVFRRLLSLQLNLETSRKGFVFTSVSLGPQMATQFTVLHHHRLSQ